MAAVSPSPSTPLLAHTSPFPFLRKNNLTSMEDVKKSTLQDNNVEQAFALHLYYAALLPPFCTSHTHANHNEKALLWLVRTLEMNTSKHDFSRQTLLAGIDIFSIINNVNVFTSPFSQILLKELSSKKKVEIIDLRKKRIMQAATIHNLAFFLAIDKKAEDLLLEGTKLRDEEVIELLEAIENNPCSRIRYINLYNCGMREKSVTKLINFHLLRGYISLKFSYEGTLCEEPHTLMKRPVSTQEPIMQAPIMQAPIMQAPIMQAPIIPVPQKPATTTSVVPFQCPR